MVGMGSLGALLEMILYFDESHCLSHQSLIEGGSCVAKGETKTEAGAAERKASVGKGAARRGLGSASAASSQEHGPELRKAARGRGLELGRLHGHCSM
jgi:hypothetical protein